jgi:choline dehydrogenase-like flavoprotein
VTGVSARDPSGRSIAVRARAVVVACGALHTPLLLARSGVASEHLGRHLTIHPVVAAWGLFDERVDARRAVPQGYVIDEHHDDGLLFQGAFAPLDVCGPLFTDVGPAWTRLIERFDHLACFGFMIEDDGEGRVRAGPGGRPLVTYSLTRADVARLRRGVTMLAEVYFAAGAREVLPAVRGFDRLGGARDVARLGRAPVVASDFDVTAYHPLGTCRMGRDPARSVIGPDHRVHGFEGLFVADGSAVPCSLGVNPQLTIMALADRAAEHVARSLEGPS